MCVEYTVFTAIKYRFYALFYRIPLNSLAHPSGADDIERVEMCVCEYLLSRIEFCHGQMESSSFGFNQATFIFKLSTKSD